MVRSIIVRTDAFGFRSSNAEPQDIELVIFASSQRYSITSARALSVSHPTMFNKATSILAFRDYDS
jgi:hypothetical protein